MIQLTNNICVVVFYFKGGKFMSYLFIEDFKLKESIKRARKINKSQRASILSKKERINMIIDTDMELLEDFENKLYNKTIDK